jgi:hypothetical protein
MAAFTLNYQMAGTPNQGGGTPNRPSGTPNSRHTGPVFMDIAGNLESELRILLFLFCYVMISVIKLQQCCRGCH